MNIKSQHGTKGVKRESQGKNLLDRAESVKRLYKGQAS
ncbi:hypothetical protein E2C01_063885 [Portunus trituberculatus]|uniref:Uncharacterized protein n=1 Tax=Portunus trituberculatus TaxID=210409 RepID=A0A5B7HJD7_PORTR|nr:hypothetical protein [Portunus trituberculatus]